MASWHCRLPLTMVSCRVIFAQTLRSQKVAKVYWVNIQMSWLNIWIQIEYSNFQLSIFWGSILSTARCASISAFFVANTHKQVRFSAACWQLPLAWRKRSGRRETATSHFFFESLKETVFPRENGRLVQTCFLKREAFLANDTVYVNLCIH